MEGEAVPPGVLVVGEVPHDWLFPRCAAVVHHGGAGPPPPLLAQLGRISCLCALLTELQNPLFILKKLKSVCFALTHCQFSNY